MKFGLQDTQCNKLLYKHIESPETELKMIFIKISYVASMMGLQENRVF